MSRADEIRELFRFNAWAMERMFGATAVLSQAEFTRDLDNSFASIQATLVHMVAADWVWLMRWLGTSPMSFPDAGQLISNADVFTRWQQIDGERREFLNTLDDAALERNVAYTNLAGINFEFPIWQMLRHVVNHNTYHRGQVMTMLRQLGQKAVSTDLILMYQEMQKAQISA